MKTKIIACGLAILPILGIVSVADAATKKPSTASAIVAALKKQKLPIGKTFVYTASNDPNHLLGRPGEYTSKITFVDTRVKEPIEGEIEVSNGGSVEVFPNATDAKNRYKYISAIAQAAPMFEEYDYLDGNVLLRVSDYLTPSQEKQYVTDLKKVLGK